jgi:flagellar biosynthesis/type III secretory pathway M-ring protein FliF/YscJ
VVSDAGKLLSDGTEGNAGDVADRMITKALNQQMALTHERETAVENKVQSLLDKLYGPGRSVVRVTMELDFTAKKTRTRLYAAPQDAKGENAPAYREHSEESTSGGTSNGGTPGTRSNVPSYPMETVGGSQSNSTTRKFDRMQNGNMSVNDQVTEDEIGRVKRMSVTALVNVAGGMSPQSLNDLTQIVTSTAGADIGGRGDQVVVRAAAFDTAQIDALKTLMDQEDAAKKADNGKKKKDGGIPLSWIIGTGAAFVILFLLLAIMRQANKKEDTTDVLVNTLGDPGLPPQFDPNALAGYNQYEMSGTVPQAGGYGEGPFSFLEQMDPELVAELISNERPPTAAGILAAIDPGYADQVLSLIDPGLADDIVNRIQSGTELPAFQQKTISQQLKRRLGVPA